MKSSKIEQDSFVHNILNSLSSLYLTVSCLLGVIILVFFGTLEQTDSGILLAQEKYFRSWLVFIHISAYSFPIFPGGYSFACVLLVNILTAAIFRFRVSKKNAGIFVIHIGLALLIGGEIFTGIFSHESQMTIKVGDTINYSVNAKETELVLIDTTEKEYDQVVSISSNKIKSGKIFYPPHTPLSLHIKKVYPNAQLQQTPGKGIEVIPIPPTKKDNILDFFTAYVEVKDEKDHSLGTWLVSNAISTKQSFHHNNRHYTLQIRQHRRYHPFSIQLKEFVHEKYDGTEIPKNFSSKINLYDSQGTFSRQALISMNQPMYYQGKTFYQSSYAENDTVSILQVVDNPGKVFPYLSSSLVASGLLLQFFFSFSNFVRRKK